MRWFQARHFTSAEEALEQAERHKQREQAGTRKLMSKLDVLRGYFGIQQELRADVPVTLLLPSQLDAITPQAWEPTDAEYQAIPRANVAEQRAWLLEQMRLIEVSKKKTQPLEEWQSMKHEILADVPTRPLKVVKPRLSVQGDPSKQRGNLRKRVS